MPQKKRILCVCSAGMNRSKYLAKFLRGKGYSTKFGGLEGYSNPKYPWKPVDKKQIEWAEIIIVVRKRLLRVLKKKFNVKGKKIIVLDVTDSKRLIPKKFANLKELDYKEFQKKWTYPQLRKAIKPYLPLK